MTCLTEIANRSACAVWSPLSSHAQWVALGTKDTGGLSFENSTGGTLELFALNLSNAPSSSASTEPTVMASVSTTSRFASLDWTKSRPEYPLGWIAGGMVDGTVLIWDVDSLLSRTKNGDHHSHTSSADPALAQQPLATLSTKEGGAVTALQFSPIESHWICIGTAHGTVMLVDLSQTAQPLVTLLYEAAHLKTHAEVTAVAWNPAVSHIVATGSGDGSVTVWDTKSKKAWCEVRAEHAGQAVADLLWNPAQGLHLLTASSDDRNPVLRVWDLGASTSMPIATLNGHQAGLLHTSWCPHDDALLLSSAKDHRTLVWDLSTLAPVAEVPLTDKEGAAAAVAAQPAAAATGIKQPSATAIFAAGAGSTSTLHKQSRYQCSWSPCIRGVALTCSLDRKVQIHALTPLLAGPTQRPPAWLKRPSCVSTAFGGVVISCSKPDPTTASRPVVVLRVVPEHAPLVRTSLQAEAMRAAFSPVEICRARRQEALDRQDATEADIWGFMRVVFETNARQELLAYLGFDAGRIAESAQAYQGQPADGVRAVTASLDGLSMESLTKVTDAEELIKRALLVGNFEAAVQVCLHAGLYADALILASCGGGELWVRTQEQYFALQAPKRPVLSMVRGIMQGELSQVVENSDLSAWQETLALLATYGPADDFPRLCVALGDRLHQRGEVSQASLCYMCALHLERSVEFWKIQLQEASKAARKADGEEKGDFAPDVLALHEFVLKVSIFLQAVGPATELTLELSDLFTQYAQALAEQGLLEAAAKYVKGSSRASNELRDRLYRGRASQRCYAALGSAPEFPFTMVSIQQSRGQTLARPSVQATHSQLQYQHQQTQVATQQQQQQQSSQSYGQSPQPSDVLPQGWIALQDPATGMTYYANQSTGETTWDRPVVSPAVVAATAQVNMDYSSHSQSSQSANVANGPGVMPQSASKSKTLVSKYGDGFVTSASHPELANQYGNIGTSNPYTGAARPGTAAAVVGAARSQAPISGTLNVDSLELSADHAPIKDTLLGIIQALKEVHLGPPDRRQLDEAEKAVAIMIKKLARGDLNDDIVGKVFYMVGTMANRDFGTALAVQTGLANHEWRDHKDWLKGIKFLIQLSAKKLL